MKRPIAVTAEELARVRFAQWAKTYAPDSTFDTLPGNGQKPWLREAEGWLQAIKDNRRGKTA